MTLGIYAVAVVCALAMGNYLGHGTLGRALLLGAGVPFIFVCLVVPLSKLLVVVLVVLPFPLVSNGLGGQPLHFVLIPGLLLLSLMQRLRLRFPSNVLLIPLGMFTLGGVVSTFNGHEPIGQLPGLVSLLFGLLFMLLTASVTMQVPVRLLAIAAVGLSGVVMSLVGVLQVFIPTLPLPGLLGSPNATETLGSLGTASRLVGPMGDYELFAEFLAIICFIQIWEIFNSRRFSRRLAWTVAAGLSLSAILATGTRSAIIQLSLELLVYASFRRRRLHTAVKLLVVVGGALLIVFPLIQPLSTGARLADRFSLIGTQGTGWDGLINRSTIWRSFLAATDAYSPRLFGVGPKYDYEGVGFFPHSLFLYLVVTLGVVATIAFALFLLILAMQLIQTWRRRRDESALMLAAVLVGFIANEIKIEFFRLVHYQAFVWALLGLSLAALDRGARRQVVQ